MGGGGGGFEIIELAPGPAFEFWDGSEFERTLTIFDYDYDWSYNYEERKSWQTLYNPSLTRGYVIKYAAFLKVSPYLSDQYLP